MKLIIDIPDKDYEFIKDLQSLIIGGRGNCKTIQYHVINAIKNGTPYKERPKGYIRKFIAKYKWHRFCKLNGYRCSECIYHDFIFEDGVIFRGIKCRYPDKGGKT